jgi:hypothetical protein
MPNPGQANNPSGANNASGTQSGPSRFGGFTTNPSQVPATRGGGYPDANLPRRVQRQPTRRPRPQVPPDVAQGRQLIQREVQQRLQRPPEPNMADLWAAVAQIPGASPLVQEYARKAAQQR